MPARRKSIVHLATGKYTYLRILSIARRLGRIILVIKQCHIICNVMSDIVIGRQEIKFLEAVD